MPFFKDIMCYAKDSDENDTFSNFKESLSGCLKGLFNPMESYCTLFLRKEGYVDQSF